MIAVGCSLSDQGLALLTLSWDKTWDSHSLVNGYPSFYPRIALVAPSPEGFTYDFRINGLQGTLLWRHTRVVLQPQITGKSNTCSAAVYEKFLDKENSISEL